MKNNKKLAIAGVSALGLAAVGFGAFAFFSDKAEQNTDGTVGTVDVGTKGDLTLENPGNINPGDEDPNVPEGSVPGTSHKLSFGIKNQGNKSIVTRNIIEIDVVAHFGLEDDGKLTLVNDTESPVMVQEKNADGSVKIVNGKPVMIPAVDKDGNPVYNKKYVVVYPNGEMLDPNIFALYMKGKDGKNVKLETINYGTKENPIYPHKELVEKDGKIVLRYVVPGATLRGVGNAAEAEDRDGATKQAYVTVNEGVTEADYDYWLGMSKETKNPNDTAHTKDQHTDTCTDRDGMIHNDKYQGSHLTINLTVQAMQNRNTSAGDYINGGDWQTVYEDTFTTGGTVTP